MQSNMFFLEKVTFPYLTKKKAKKEAAYSFLFFLSVKLQLRASCDFLLPAYFGPAIIEYWGSVALALPFKFILLK